MGDRWSVEDGWVLFDGEAPAVGVVAAALGMASDEYLKVTVEQRNADPRTNPPKVEMVPWAEVDTRPGKHLPACGAWWSDVRSHPENPRIVVWSEEGYEVERYGPGSSVPVRSSDGEA